MEVIRISIGTEPLQHIPCEVLKASILRRTTRPVEFSQSWTKADGWHPAMEELPRLQGTKFSRWRWLVPSLYAHRGKAIYLDADQVVLSDIGELWDSLQDGYAFAAVKNAVGIFGKHKRPEPGAVQSSVMVMDCERCDWNALKFCNKVARGEMPYRDLMQAKFLHDADIQELPPYWNHFGLHQSDTKLLHWSHVKSQPYRKPEHPTAHIFKDELHAGVRAGLVNRSEVVEACTTLDTLCSEYLNGLPHAEQRNVIGGVPDGAMLRSIL